MDAPIWSVYVTAAVAVYGAALSSWNAWVKYRENRPNVKVKTSYGFETYGPSLGPNSVFITAMNKGSDVTLTSAGFRLPDKRTVALLAPSGTARFPQLLQSASSCFVTIPIRQLAREIREAGFSGEIKLVGYYRDALDQEHVSKGFKFDVNREANSRS